ncbi:MAG: HlyC/CorC family transporter [Ignavibacteriae bacterium]|nr:HlyC/CorC family transporter [Ignavibacteriota bacterium]
METFWIEFIGVILLVLLVAFFSAAEVSVLATRKSRMQELADEGNAAAAIILGFQTNPEHFLATVHVGNIFAMILASVLGGVIGFQVIVPALGASSSPWIVEMSNWIALVAIVVSVGSLVVIFGELVPKSLALRSAEPVALALAGPIRFFATVFRVPARTMTFASNFVLRPFKDTTTFTESRMSEEEFKLMLEEGTKSGVIDKTEHRLITSIFEFTETTVREVMVPRPDVVAVNITTPREELVRIVLEEGYSRLPVFKDSIDHIVGIVYTKDLLGLLEYRNVIILQDILRPPFFVPEGMKISQLMQELQRHKLHMAVVKDEFGGTEGIITMEDIIEEIVGEIHDEYDEELKDVEQTAEGTFLLNGRLSIFEFNERFGAEIPEDAGFETIGGFLLKLAGRIPDVNEVIPYKQMVFTIVRKSQRRIRVVTVKISSAS